MADRSRPVRGLPVEARHQAAHGIQEGVPDVQRRYPGGTFLKIQEKPTNNDLQGTAATVLAGLYGAMKVRGLTPADLKNQVLPVSCFMGLVLDG